MISRCICFLSCLLFFFGGAHLQAAQAQTLEAQDAPEITLRGDVDLGEFRTSTLSEPLILESLSVSVDVRAGLAQVSISATLRNETDEDIEASFAYPLPRGAVINGYALDIDGNLVDGVLMPKERAEALYTDRVTQSIDPGIAARTADNRYRTRIYPIAAEGGRRSIRLDFAVPVPTSGLRLPLRQIENVEHVNIQIMGEGAELARLPIDGDHAKNTSLSGGIFVPAVPSLVSLSAHSGLNFLTVPLDAQSNASTLEASSVAIIWDTSLSRESGSLAAETRFIGALLDRLAPTQQSLIHGADKVNFAARYESPSDLVAAIGRVTYDGATDLARLLDIQTLQRQDLQSDICVVISD